ncbi:MAG: right-handed parallel beta-helix repeat-containing protein [Candidatus Krumholzibacteriaceae bacterium]
MIVGKAHDDDGDSLTFTWKASAGSFTHSSSSGDTTYWRAPASTGPVKVTMTVSDDITKVSMSQVITVCTPFPSSIGASTTIANTGAVYLLLNDDPLRVPAGVTLTIEPGVTIVVDKAGGGLEVYGDLVARGTPENRIKIQGNTCSVGSELWGGIYLEDPSCDAAFKYVDITMSYDGIKLSAGARATIDSCEIYNNDYGVWVELVGSDARIRSCKIWENGLGIYVLNAKADIRGSSVRYSDGNGIELSFSLDATDVTIDSFSVANNGQSGIQLSEKAAPEIHYCSIFSNGVNPGEPNYGVRLASYVATDSVHAERNYWGLGNTTAARIAAVIYDAQDNPSELNAFVSFVPWLSSAPVMLAPMDEPRVKGIAWAR